MSRKNCEFSCINNMVSYTQPCISSPAHHVTMLTALVTFVCLSSPLEPRLAFSLGPSSSAVVNMGKSTGCEGHTLQEYIFAPSEPRGFFTL